MPQGYHAPDIPSVLQALASQVRGRSWENAKRVVLSKVGSVQRGERFSADVADAVFLRLQRNAQSGTYASESDVAGLGRKALRLDGSGDITLYRSAPPGGGIRPGDCAAGNAREAGFYCHSGNVVQWAIVPRASVFKIAGSGGYCPEYIFMPQEYMQLAANTYYLKFVDFYKAANLPANDPEKAPKPNASPGAYADLY